METTNFNNLASAENLAKWQEIVDDANKNLSKGTTTSTKMRNLSKYSKALELAHEGQKTIELHKETSKLINDSDDDLAEIAREDITNLEAKFTKITDELQYLIDPPEEAKFHNAIIEIRAGAGGDEASLFAGELQRMYTLYAQRNDWTVKIVDSHENEAGGIKTAVMMIEGDTAYVKLIKESGVHRVQRIPSTESSGRIHTSTASVAVLPELEDIEIEIRPEDIEMESMKAGGPGGQSVNTTNSAIRIYHKPTGLVVTCRETKSQIQNRERAMQLLKSRLYQIEKDKQESQIKGQRSQQIGTGDRSEKIRTYNFPQDRLTDHRIKKSWHNIPKIMDGFIDDIVESMSSIKS